jgi:hypothetical protein
MTPPPGTTTGAGDAHTSAVPDGITQAASTALAWSNDSGPRPVYFVMCSRSMAMRYQIAAQERDALIAERLSELAR